MENAKKIDAICLGFDEESLPCERELMDLCDWSARTVVANDLDVDEDGNLVGTMVISFGPDYSAGRKIKPDDLAGIAAVVNDVIGRRCEEEADPCAGCDGCDYPDAGPDDVAKINEALDQLIAESEDLLKALRKAAGK